MHSILEANPGPLPSHRRIGWLVLAWMVLAWPHTLISGRHDASASVRAQDREAAPLAGWNVLLVTLDTLRADRVGCYGYERAETPVLDQLAADGARCKDVHVSVPLTVPSHASILTGTYPIWHGARNNANYPLPDSNQTMAEILRDAGYQTAAIIASQVMSKNFQLDQGFDHYDDQIPDEESPAGKPYRLGEHTTRHTLDWIRARNPNRPFLVWSHYYDPHGPYRAPPPFGPRFAESPYDGEVAYVDHCLGLLLAGLAELGLAERTLVIVTSDHGEGLGDPHAEQTHGILLYEEALRVPLLFRAPGSIPGGATVDGLVRSIDILPTVLEFLGVEAPTEVQGASLAGAMYRNEPWPSRTSYFDTIMPREAYGWSAMFGLRDGSWKYIRAPRPELFHLADDPLESHNLAEIETERLALMEADLVLLESTLGREEANRPQRGDLSEEMKEKLRSLGYVVNESSVPVEDSGKDPKDFIAVQNHLNDAMGLHGAGRLDAALAELERAARIDPDNNEILRQQGTILLERGDLEGAATTFHRLIARNPDDFMAQFRLGQANRDRAKAAETAGNIGAADELRGDAAEAYGRALTINPKHALSLLDLANILVREGTPEESIDLYRRAYESNPRLSEARINRAMVLRSLERFEEAVEELEWLESHGTRNEMDTYNLRPVLAEMRGELETGAPWPLWAIGLAVAAVLGAAVVLVGKSRRASGASPGGTR